jgi:hypothetical protein
MLMQQNAEKEQMQDGGRGGMLRAARRRCDRFAYSFYALPPDVAGRFFFVEAGLQALRSRPFAMFFRRG